MPGLNSYSRETLQGGWHKTSNGPYAGPRGNPVMKAKRTTGPSANAVMNLRHTRDLALERGQRADAIEREKADKALVQSLWWLREG